ncbi:MAG: 2-oxoglutarate dehydrogenase, subunit, partial [Solirubrobacterales bacterium]|nr:2-oxoglutarate dehydrogenase, subunit [Solirubrobacterales bacterium]
MAINTTIQVVAPGAGESVTEGEILEWHVKEGDHIALDETIVEISTDKVDVEVPSPASGTIVKLHAEEGETITVGQLLAEIQPDDGSAPATPDAAADDGDGAQQPAGNVSSDPAGTGTAPPATGNVDAEGDLAHSPAQTEAAQDTAAGELLDIVTPGAGESVTEGDILEWHVKVGDTVEADQTIVEISTDKVDVELPAPAAGTIAEILAEEGETVTVGQVIARLKTGAAAGPSAAPSGDGAPAASADQAAAPSRPAGDGASAPDGVKASPVAARVAAAQGVDLTGVAGSGPQGRITKADVLDAKANGGASSNGATAAAPAAKPAGAKPIKGAAAMLARYMDESRAIPTATSFRTVTVTAMDGRRKELKAAGQKVSFTHLIAYAIALSGTQDMPVMAHHFDEIDGKPHRIDDGAVNLGIAVDVTNKKGERTLMVPVIRDAGRLSFSGFKAAFDELIDKARTNTLTADDLQGANISLTNPGGIGTIASVPRLMVGQGTIVATGSIAYPVGLGNIGDMIGAEKVMTMTSTYDHRIIQGAESGQFLKTVEEYLQGEHGFYEGIFHSLDAPLGAAPQPPAPAAAARDRALAGPPAAAGGVDEELLQGVQAAVSLVKAHRTHGHLAARLDPLGSEPEGDPALNPEPLGLTPELMARIPAKILRVHVPGATLADALPHLRETYCGTIAYEIEHIASHRQRVWLREKIESGAFRTPLTNDEQLALLKRLIEVDAMERFMHKAYLGQKQFSIEGLDMTVPMIDEMIQLSAAHGAREVVLGMAHRGRLNVLAHNLGRPYESIFAEFEGASTLEAITTIPQGGTGDVKYHHGAQGSYQLPDGSSILVNLESNPSHLEFVHPVVVGASRAAQTTRQGPHAHRDTSAAVPIVLHGDAAFPGQGVVAESLNLQALDGYQVGGTMHIITNNQIGFTTDPEDSRSTRWASDPAKGFDVPIIHVNADDVAACVSAVRLAFAFRQEFGHDVLIDVIGYRRFGHNEADEPAYTQPEMTAVIKKKKRVAELFAEKLVADGVVSADEVEAATKAIWDELTRLHAELKEQIKAAADSGSPTQQTGEYTLDRSPSPEVKTAVSSERLLSLNDELLNVPEGFTVHPKLVKQLERRRKAVGPDGGIDWAHAEALAFGSLLTEGIPIRITGQDVQRGTFSHRHLVLHDAKNGQAVSPIQNLPGA